MKTFQQFLESVPPGVSPHKYHLGEIQSVIDSQQKQLDKLGQKNNVLMKALAKIKIDLERALKDKTKLNDAVYSAIDIARSLTPYSSDYGMSHKLDDPLSDIEKTL